MSRRLLVLAVAGLFWPTTGPAADAPPFPYSDATLANGLRVVSLEDFSCPVVAVHLWYHVGSKDELPERQGFAHMFEHMMFRGTDRLGPEDHFKFIRRTGGDCNAYTAFDQTVYVQELPAHQLELALWLEAERMAFLRIDQASFDTERKVVEEERRLGLNRPYGSLPEKLLAELYRDHPYRWSPIGQIPHLRAAAVGELRDFWQRYYVPNNATLVVVGAVKHEDVLRLAERYFGWMPREADPPRVSRREPPRTQARAVTLRDDNAPAPGVGIVWRTVPAREGDAVPLELLGTILGGGESSRLYRKLVAEGQIAVIATAGSFELEQDGFVGCAAALAPFSRGGPKALEVMRQEVERLRAEPVSAAELLKAKNQKLAAIATGNLTAASRATLLGTAVMIEGDVGRVNRRLAAVQAVTVADLQRVAKQYLAPEQALTVTVEQNLFGALFGRGKSFKDEEDAPITAKPETGPPPAAKAGLRRPADFPVQPPVADPSAARVNLPVTRRTLPNGMKVLVVTKPGVPYVNVQLGLTSGAWTEAKPGTASLVMQMLTRGTARHTEKELSEELDTYAIRLSGGAGMDWASVGAGCLTEHLPRAIALMAEAVRSPTFPDDELTKLRKQVLTGLAVTDAEPSSKAERELCRRLYGHHPYARAETGTVKDVQAVGVADLRQWWSASARPDQAVLIFAGDVAAPQALALAEQAFGGWKASGEAPRVDLPDPPAAGATHVYLVDQPGAIQSQIRVGQRSIARNHSDYPTARVVTDYFGGAFNSRLNEVIRVQKGLTYGARGGYSPSRFAGQFVISTFSKTESTAAAVSASLAELERLMREPPTGVELKDTQTHFAGSFVRERETPQQVANGLWTLELHGLPADHFERTLERVARTSADDCARLLRETIDPSKVVVVVVGSADRLKADLEKIAPVTVVKPE